MVDTIVLDENLPNLCRLCLKVDDFIVDIFHRLDPKPNKVSLPERIYDFYQVKVSKSDGLPTNICHRCLYFTESFTEFRDNVRKCEAQLQKHIVSIGVLGSSKLDVIKKEQIDNEYCDNRIQDYSINLPNSDDYMVTVVDPNQEYESSNDCFSIGSDNGDYQTIDNNNLNDQNLNSSKESNSFDLTQNEQQLSTTIFNSSTTNDSTLESILEQTSRNVFLCEFCDIAFKSQKECTEHEKQQHDINNPFTCNFCPFHSKMRHLLINHIKELHDADRPYLCKLCNKGFVRRSDLKKHAIVHTGVRPFACPVCGKNFSRNTNLTKHIRIHSGVKPYVCIKCSRTFTTPGDLMRHEKTHEDFKPFKCNKCDSSFSRKDKLNHHERIHLKQESVLKNNNSTGILIGQENLPDGNFTPENMIISLDPFSDMNQVANFNQQNQLLMQQQQQQQQQKQNDKDIGETKIGLASEQLEKQPQRRSRIHICTICAKVFTRKRELQRHVNIHSTPKPLYCRFCNKRFIQKNKLYRHEKTHNDQRFACNQCKLVFSKQEALDMHIKVHDLNKINTPPHEIQKVPNFLESLQEGVTPQLNFYSEIRPE